MAGGGLAVAGVTRLPPCLALCPPWAQFMDLIEQVEKRTPVADLLASFNDQSI